MRPSASSDEAYTCPARSTRSPYTTFPVAASAQYAIPLLSFIQYRCPSWYTGDDTFDPLSLVHRRCVAVTSPLPPVRTARPATPLRPPMLYTTPSCAIRLGTMYQVMLVLQVQSG